MASHKNIIKPDGGRKMKYRSVTSQKYNNNRATNEWRLSHFSLFLPLGSTTSWMLPFLGSGGLCLFTVSVFYHGCSHRVVSPKVQKMNLLIQSFGKIIGCKPQEWVRAQVLSLAVQWHTPLISSLMGESNPGHWFYFNFSLWCVK